MFVFHSHDIYIDKMKVKYCQFSNIPEPVEYRIGKNAKDNFAVIDSGNPHDIWFHACHVSSCHVLAILPQTLDKKQLDTIIKKGADLCKENTASVRNIYAEFMYTELQNVTKTNTAGMVFCTEKKTIWR